jgi:hypothetical protein
MTAGTSELNGYSTMPEPCLIFAGGGLDSHPLRGLVDHGPYSKVLGVPTRVRLAQLAPKGLLRKLHGILQELGTPAKPREAINYYPDYPGFEPLFRTRIAAGDRLRFEMAADLDDLAQQGNRLELARQLFDAIGKVGVNRAEFDVLLMYLPSAWEACCESPGVLCTHANSDSDRFGRLLAAQVPGKRHVGAKRGSVCQGGWHPLEAHGLEFERSLYRYKLCDEEG